HGAGDKAAGQRLVVDKTDDRVAVLAGDLDAFAQMRHVTVDPQQLVAVAKALTLRIRQEQDRPTWATAHSLQDRACHRQSDFNTYLGMVGGPQHRNCVRAAVTRPYQKIAVLSNVVPLREEPSRDRSPLHLKSPGFRAVVAIRRHA